MTYRTAYLDELVEDPHNARLHDMANLTAIRASLLRFGQVEPLVVRSGTQQVVGGNGRLQVMRALGWETAEIREVDLSDDEAIALGLALNRTAELATWDETMLRTHLKTLSDAEFDIGGFALNEEDLKSIKFDVDEPTAVEGKTDADEVPEPPAEPITKPGDLWILGNHLLLCGDSTNPQHVERLMDGKKADMVFTDPPYGVSIGQQTQGASNRAKKNNYGPCQWDKKIPYDAISLALTLAPNIILWGANYYAEKLPPSSCWIVWDKENTGDFADAELAWTNQDTAVRIFKHMWNGVIKASERGQKRIHPTQKPVALAEWCFENYGDPAIVLDLFLGSGSTLIACEKLGKACYGMEMSPAYCDVIVKRWEDFTGQKAVRA